MTTETLVIIVFICVVAIICLISLTVLIIGTGQKIIGAFNRLMDEIDDLMAGNCMRRCAQRKTKDQLSKDRLTDIAMKELWGQVGGSKEKSPLRPLPEDLIKLKALMEAKELPDIIGICRGCGLLENCDKCDYGLTECEDFIDDHFDRCAGCQSDASAVVNLDCQSCVELAKINKETDVAATNQEAAESTQDNKEIPTLNDSHKTALGKCDGKTFFNKVPQQGGDVRASLSDGETQEAKEIEPFIDSTPYGND